MFCHRSVSSVDPRSSLVGEPDMHRRGLGPPPLNGQSLPPFGTSSAQNQPSPFRGHANKKAMGPFSLRIAFRRQIFLHDLFPLFKLISVLIDHNEIYLSR